MIITIPHFINFKMKFTTNRETILRTKIQHLRKADISDIMIESILYSQRYGMKEINSILNE